MIAYLQGKITHKSPTHIYLDVNGIGYMVHISLHTYSKIEALSELKIFTYYHVKEDSHTLFGFYDEEEKSYFSLLLSVSGIGPNTARVILSYMTTEEVQSAILAENVAALSSVKGIGPKTAKRIILDLKDKVAKEGGGAMTSIIGGQSVIREEATSALMALGFPKTSIMKNISALLKKDPSINSVEELIKKVLKQMT